jgi:hypothetical protein
VLLDHQVVAEQLGAEQTARKRAEYLERQVALATALEQVAKGKVSPIPRNLKDLFDSRTLRIAVAAHRQEVKAARKSNKGNPHYKVNWQACAESLMMQKFSGQVLYDWPITPWDRVIGKLIGKCKALALTHRLSASGSLVRPNTRSRTPEPESWHDWRGKKSIKNCWRTFNRCILKKLKSGSDWPHRVARNRRAASLVGAVAQQPTMKRIW